MAIETTTTCIYPSGKDYAIMEYEGFGWKFESSEKFTNNVGELVEKLKFTRDKEMPNYPQLSSKFDLYIDKEEEMKKIARQQDMMGEKPEKVKFNGIIAFCSLFLGGFGLICYIIAFIIKNKNAKKEIEEYDFRYNKLQKRFEMLDAECEQILTEAKTLL